eukprot:CAMPEP_0198145554 /NCGR_PEP_ID=MMETSP1443-20131203/24304_1 /TAXON_ID=186043 /ORGANISM="Entomoneis sp., Strain CCMP2396" /LENGTH=218 /DNA_ID=CAMNT_0043809241 /DNA_START=202 /DNA_END=858 /DNA_ORIENTATION=-
MELPEALRNAAASQGMIPLDGNYQPTPYDIVCGRGRGNYNCDGNILFRSYVSQYTEEYLKSESKASKTLVLIQVLEQVKRESNGRCRFVKQRQEDGLWCELGEVAAREKAGHAMRESIATRKKLNTSKRPRFFTQNESSTASLSSNGGGEAMDVDMAAPYQAGSEFNARRGGGVSDVVFGQRVASLPEKLLQDDSVLSAVGSSDFLACRSSEFLQKYG